MNILGITGLGVAPAACLVRDGRLVAMAEEERFNRVKGSFGMMPEKAAQFCLAYSRLTLDDIDYIAFPWDTHKYRFYMPYFLLGAYLKHSPKNVKNTIATGSTALGEILKYRSGSVKNSIISMLRKAGLKGRVPSIVFIPHHVAHAASAYYLSGFDESYILIVDGSGEDKCTTIFKGKGLDIEERKCFRIPDSLGWFYQSVTEFLGFLPNMDEGKTMALAAYGRYNEEVYSKFGKMLSFDGTGDYKYDASYGFLGGHAHGAVFGDKMVGLFGEPRHSEKDLSQLHKDIALAAQDMLEKVVVSLVKKISREPDYNKKLCIAGGVGLNCRMNGVIALRDYIDGIFIPPIANDAGSALGAALYLSKEKGADPRFKMEHACWGPEFSNDEIKRALEKSGVEFKEEPRIEAAVAKLLSQDKVVGWFQGRMETGPRALGARSILANPIRGWMKDKVNKIKNREAWRPFAPSLLNEKGNEYLIKPRESPFMTMAFEMPEKMREMIPSVIHIDNTTRPHCVKKEIDPRYWRLIDEFERISGVPLILNTSFNIRGEPIVCSPLEALRTFRAADMDYLAIGDFLVSKR